jgi:hypothetical protein
MSDPRRPAGPPEPPAEPFLERWSRRKAEARAGLDEAPAAADEPAAGPRDGSDPAAPAAVELPDLDSLDQDSDYSAFMAQGVDESLRRQALRKLFRSPKFNVCDGLDDYCGDYTRFEQLGDVVTADMRFQLERAAKAAERLLAEGGQPGPGPEAPAAAAAQSAAGSAGEPTPEDSTSHDEPDRPA